MATIIGELVAKLRADTSQWTRPMAAAQKDTTDLGTMVTPAIAGLLVAKTGVATAYFLCALATTATVGLITAIGPSPPPQRDLQNPLRELASGISFALRHESIRLILATGLIGMLVSGPLVLLPAGEIGYPFDGMVLFVVNQHEVVILPEAFAREAAEHVIHCESTWNTEAVNELGCLGWLQICPIHFQRMRAMRLDPQREADRLTFGAVLWREQGWVPWDCRR